MVKFTKLSESASKIIYEVFECGDIFTVEYDKNTKKYIFFDENGKEYNPTFAGCGFLHVIRNNFPDKYLYAFC